MTSETVFLRTFSDLGVFQKGYRLEYSLITNTNAGRRYGIAIKSFDTTDFMLSQCTFCELYDTYSDVMQLLQFFYENGITPSAAKGILQDFTMLEP